MPTKQNMCDKIDNDDSYIKWLDQLNSKILNILKYNRFTSFATLWHKLELFNPNEYEFSDIITALNDMENWKIIERKNFHNNQHNCYKKLCTTQQKPKQKHEKQDIVQKLMKELNMPTRVNPKLKIKKQSE